MKVYIGNEIIDYENTTDCLEKLFEDINKKIVKENSMISNIEINGEKFYSEFDKLISENITSISELKIFLCSDREYVMDVLSTTIDYATNAIISVEELSSEFYKNPNGDAWNSLADLFDSISWIMESFQLVNEKNKEIFSDELWQPYVELIKSMQVLVDELAEVMESDDIVSIADLLLYEVVPLFTKTKIILIKLLD